MKALRNLLYVLIATTLAGLFQSCINDNYPIEDPATDDNSVYLVLHIGLATPTRASNLPNELMHTLRIVLLDENGDIEYNKRVEDLGVSEYGYHIISTKTGKKKIYLIANEGCVDRVNGVNGEQQSLTNLLDNLKNGNASTTLDNVYFTPSLHGIEQRIPISAYYEFEITEEELKASNSRQAKRDFDLVYAATKFEIRFENYLNTSVTINKLSISFVADDMYLFAHFEGDNETTLLKTMPEAQGGGSWIEWLKEVSEETTAKPNLPDNEDINNAYEWLTDYVLPTNTHNELAIITQSTGNNTIGGRTNGNTPGTLSFTNLYTTESKYIPQGGTEQKYTLDVTLTSNGNNGNTQTKKFEPQEIPNLRTLFRNTHAIITVSIRQDLQNLQIDYTVCPWDEKSTDITFK